MICVEAPQMKSAMSSELEGLPFQKSLLIE